MQQEKKMVKMDTARHAGSGSRAVPVLAGVEGASSPWMFPHGAVTE